MMRMEATPLSASAALWVLLGCLAWAPVQADIVETVEGNPETGRWLGARPDAVVWQTEGGGRQELKIEDVVRIELDRAALDGITSSHPHVWDVLREFAEKRG